MNRKTVAWIAIIMVVVFGTMTLLYPTLFSPDSASPVEPAPPPAAPAP